MTNPILDVRDLEVKRGSQTVLQVDALSIEPGEVLAVIGPNGAGKSTLLLAVSTLIPITRGAIHFHGQPLSEMDNLEYRRRIGLVFQAPLLLDGTVYDNIATGLRFRGMKKADIDERVQLWLERLGITALRKRRALALSGGEAQRVSLARALSLNPDVLMLDEPFSALDAPTRMRLLEDFQPLLRELKITTLLVTHDLNEALLMGDRVAVIFNGRLGQVGTPQEVFTAPANPEIAGFVGVETVIPGKVVSGRDGLLSIQADGYLLEAVGEALPERAVLVCLRPEDITLWRSESGPSSARNRLKGRVLRLMPQGPLVRVVVDCGFQLVALITRASADELALDVGQEVTASFKATAVHLIHR